MLHSVILLIIINSELTVKVCGYVNQNQAFKVLDCDVHIALKRAKVVAAHLLP